MDKGLWPSVFDVEGLPVVAHVVSERWVAHRHTLLTPLQSWSIDGFHRVYGPARQVSVEKTKKKSSGFPGTSQIRGMERNRQSPVELLLGSLWDVAFRQFGFVVRKQTLNAIRLIKVTENHSLDFFPPIVTLDAQIS